MIEYRISIEGRKFYVISESEAWKWATRGATVTVFIRRKGARR